MRAQFFLISRPNAEDSHYLLRIRDVFPLSTDNVEGATELIAFFFVVVVA